ncbi:MAG TPA: hypothetical protein VFQ20_12940 [Burkholderiaceae bacterium]|nr:hypothetical protein [Burkholderiaceae bacterium]
MPIRPLIVAVATATIAAAALADGGNPIRMTIAAGKVGETCMTLAVGDTLVWQFSADTAGDFNVHHHVGKDVLMPVDRKAVRADRGELAIDRANDWCLMWTAPKGSPMSLSGAWSVRKASAPR